jgi:hypothetical protein
MKRKSTISESKLRRIIQEEFRTHHLRILKEKTWADLKAPMGKPIPIYPEDFDKEDCPDPPCDDERDLDDEIFDLIQVAYGDVPLGDGKFGNIKVQKPDDLPAGYTVMSAAELDGDPEPDYFRGGKMRAGRMKMGIVGHDGSEAAINMYLEKTAEGLKAGDIGEMSGKIAHIMITRYGVPAVTSKEEVEALTGKKVDWVGRHPEEKYADRYGPDFEGWYCRGIGSCKSSHMKILLGGV